ncbi:MAG: DciA family protein [Patescibacteria group bacterium]|jgi:hypothetical protein
MQAISKQDILKRLNQAGVANTVQAAMVVEAFQLYLASEFPDINANDCTPLFVQGGVLVVRSTHPELMHCLRDRQTDICEYVLKTTGKIITRLQFRTS